MAASPPRTTRRLTRRGRIVFGALATALIVSLGVGGGAAFAYFSATGGYGSGHATIANGDQAITVATNATAGTSLRPGGTGDLVITATNPNNRPVQITALTIGSVTGCTTPSVTLSSPTTYLPVSIPANANSSRIDIAGALAMGAASSNDCQGKSLTINLASVTVQQ